MAKYEYKYVQNILVENKPVQISEIAPKFAEQALNDLGKANWRLITTTMRNGSTIAWIFRKEIKKNKTD